MQGWNIADNGDGTFILLNGSDTIIKKHKQVPVSCIVELMSKLEEIQFPIIYTDGLKEIYFTYLKSKLEGEYLQEGVVRIGCNNALKPKMHQIFIHEVGHHVDAEGGFSDDERLRGEWSKKSGSFVHVDIKNDPGEYWAIGFERWYTTDLFALKDHPVLCGLISNLHVSKVGS